MPHPENEGRISLSKAFGLIDFTLSDSDNEGDLCIGFTNATVLVSVMEVATPGFPASASTISLTPQSALELASKLIARLGEKA